jgi:hypothetical protein
MAFLAPFFLGCMKPDTSSIRPYDENQLLWEATSYLSPAVNAKEGMLIISTTAANRSTVPLSTRQTRGSPAFGIRLASWKYYPPSNIGTSIDG